MGSEQRRRGVGVLVPFVVRVLFGGAVLIAERHFGAELGEPCRQGEFFPCRSLRFKAVGVDEMGRCSQPCRNTSEYLSPWSCEVATWGQSDSARAERVCVPLSAVHEGVRPR